MQPVPVSILRELAFQYGFPYGKFVVCTGLLHKPSHLRQQIHIISASAAGHFSISAMMNLYMLSAIIL